MLCGCCLQLLRPQPVAKAVLWRAAPAEGQFRFVIVPVQPEMDVGMSVPPEMASVGGKTATRIVYREG
jgi:hypothetical protein